MNHQSFLNPCFLKKTLLHQHVLSSLALILILLLPFHGFAEVGVESRKIVLGTHEPLSGPQNFFSAIGKGASIFFHYLNDQGGVHGRKVVLLRKDDRFQPERTLEVVTDMVLKKKVFSLFSGIGTDTSRISLPLLKSIQVPHFFIASNALELSRPVQKGIYSFLPTLETEVKVLGKYITSMHPGEKVIIWYRNHPEFLNASKMLGARLGGNPKKFLPSKPNKSHYTAEWKAIQNGNPKVVVAVGPYGPLIKFLKNSPSNGPIIYTGMSLAESTLPDKLDPVVLKNLRILTAIPLLLEKEHQGIRLHHILLEEYEPDFEATRWSVYGHAVAELMTKVLDRSGRNLTRKSAILATDSLKDWQGMLMPPVAFSSNQHLAISFLRVSQIISGQVNHLSTWIDGR